MLPRYDEPSETLYQGVRRAPNGFDSAISWVAMPPALPPRGSPSGSLGETSRGWARK